MKYLFSQNNTKKILQVKLFEEGTINDVKKVVFSARTKALRLNYSLLYDFTEFINQIEVSEIYNLYRGKFTHRLLSVDPSIFKIKVAIYGNQKDSELLDFAETTCFNAGVSFRVFYDKKLATDWLCNNKVIKYV